MRHNKLALYVHFVWSTWDRTPLIAADTERRLHRVIQAEAESLGCHVIEINGVEDHVHVLLSFPPTQCLSEILKKMKGVSSRFANRELGFDESFKWQAAYAALTVSRWDVKRVRDYIKRQKEHHANGTLKPEFETMDEISDEEMV